jgi:hypothetical protein
MEHDDLAPVRVAEAIGESLGDAAAAAGRHRRRHAVTASADGDQQLGERKRNEDGDDHGEHGDCDAKAPSRQGFCSRARCSRGHSLCSV